MMVRDERRSKEFFATTMAIMRDATDVLATRRTPLSPDLKVQVEKEIEGFVAFRALFSLPTNHSGISLV